MEMVSVNTLEKTLKYPSLLIRAIEGVVATVTKSGQIATWWSASSDSRRFRRFARLAEQPHTVIN